MKHELPDGFTKDVVGYCDPLSVSPGEQIGFKLSAWGDAIGQTPEVEIVELISGDDRPHGTGLIERSLAVELDVDKLEHQPLIPGSYALVEDVPGQNVQEIGFWFYPTLLRSEPQTLFAWGDLQISVSESDVVVRGHSEELALAVAMQHRRWYRLVVLLGEQSSLALHKAKLGVSEQDTDYHVEGGDFGELQGGALHLACSTPGIRHFNGRIEAPYISSAEGDIARWDFGLRMDSQAIRDVSGNERHGVLAQTPTRGVTGSSWDATTQNYQHALQQYAAIHFHEDDITDAGWKDSISWSIPDDLHSGVYALKVNVAESEDYVPFFVKAPRDKRNKLAFLVPTASYLAYANQRVGFVEGPFGDPKLRHANEAFQFVHRDAGYSMYEYHHDHSGVHFSSRLRPIINMKPRNGTWAFNADTHITAWLAAIEQPFDVLTDEDLHLEGAEALHGYKCVITGTHPEYYSTAMREGLAQWLNDGGRLMYMGGNGFYWRVAFQPDNPAVMEVRRAEDGTRAWIAQPGEYYHQFTGEYGGLWRRLGGPPNELVGIGFAAQGFDGGTHYRLQPGALDPRASFIMEGVHNAEVIGNYGNQGGGAAGEEIDRWDRNLGSPEHALILATSEEHRPGMLRVKEEYHMMEEPVQDQYVRADMVFFEVPGGGAVFSTGSISYAGSLAHNDYDNDIATITGNVMRRFIDDTPFAMPGEME